MKRSEMINIIYGEIMDIKDTSPKSYLDLTKHEAIELVMDLLESKGMLPPGDKYTVHGVVTHLNNEWDKE